MIITIECYCPSQWGQNLFVIGSLKELGSWDDSKAIALNCIAPNKWKTEIKLTGTAEKTFSYKFFLKDESSGFIQWEFVKDREFSDGSARFENIHIKDIWSYPGVQHVWKTSAFSDVIFKRDNEDVKPYVLPAKAESIIEFKINAPRVGRNQQLAIVGSCKELGSWNEKKALLLNASDFPVWKLAINAAHLPKLIEYKYFLLDKKTRELTVWEAQGNRFVYLDDVFEKSHYHINEGLFRYPNDDLKGAGVSLPVFSIRTNDSFGVGEFSDLTKLVDWSVKTGLKMIQVLPVNDTISTNSFLDSYPYKAISVFALHPLYINIFKVGILKDEKLATEYKKLQKDLNKKPDVDYELVLKLKVNYLKTLFKEKKNTFLKSKAFTEFFKNNSSWLIPYAAFSFLRDEYGTSDFSKWGEYKKYSAAKIKKLIDTKSKEYESISFWYFVQFYLDKQLKEAVSYSKNKGVAFKGDIPIGISRYSVDAWYEPRLYHFDGQAGAPPDDFSEDGQNWGFPTYNWKEMAKDNYQWWRGRLTKMAEYFDAYRIDHILGFFRIWEIPFHAVQGILGHFRPDLPFSAHELESKGVWVDYNRFCKPYIRGHFLYDIFNSYTEEVIEKYLVEKEYNIFELRESYATQRKIYDFFVGEGGPEDLKEKEKTIMWGLVRLAAEVLLLPADGLTDNYHPRISMHDTYSFKELDDVRKERFNELYIDYFYRRHEEFWKQQALEKLPALVDATNMLVCGEDLGMIPASVPEVMNQFNILSLEIQRMPKDPKKTFAHPADAPYMSVCTTSTHDMSTIRGWWEESRDEMQVFYKEQMGNWGEMPYFAEPWLCKEIIVQHLHSPAMWTIFPIQDLLAMDEKLRSKDTNGERINDPANPRHYWKYRLHVSMEELLKANDFNKLVENIVSESGRKID
ncbi:MAG: 4-alpha-glucanotransferase [Salinivirgaceae bacterium]|nr:4-alpha-glucanotransferase [Salinivirgaceae bacterium]